MSLIEDIRPLGTRVERKILGGLDRNGCVKRERQIINKRVSSLPPKGWVILRLSGMAFFETENKFDVDDRDDDSSSGSGGNDV